MIKYMLVMGLVIWMMIPSIVHAYGIFSTGTASEDSISISIFLTDSLGNPADNSADSFYICVIGPSGDSIMAIAGTASTAGLNIDSMNTGVPVRKYLFADAISEIDGAGRSGTYELTFCAKSNNPEYVNCARTNFQVIDDQLSTQLAAITIILDSVIAVLDTVRSQDDWISSFDPATDTVQADAAKISGDAAAADNFETMLDGTGGNEFTLSSLDIRATGNDTAVIIEADGAGTGLGLYILGGGNGGEGLKIEGGNTKSALVAQAGSSVGAVHGFDLIGDGTGVGLNGSISNATREAIADDVWDEDTSGHSASGSFGLMLKDTAAYQGSASGLTAAEIADSIWGHLLDTAWASGTFGDSAKGWGATSASSLDSGVVQRITNRNLDSVQGANVTAISDDVTASDNLETMLDGTGGEVLSLRQLRIIGTGANDTALIAQGSGSGIGMYVEGGSSGEGLMAKGHGGRHAIYGFVQDGNGWGMYLRGNGTAGGLCIDADDNGNAVWFKGGTNSGNAMYLSADNGHGLEASGGGGNEDITADIAGSITWTDSIGDGAVDAIWNEARVGHTGAGTFGRYLDTTISSISSTTGDGTYPVTLTVYDSSSNQVVPGARLSVYNENVDALIATGLTDPDGAMSLNLDSSGYLISTFAPGFIFTAYDTIIVSGTQNDSITGYQFDPGSPDSPKLCRVYGFFYGIDGLPVEAVNVTAELADGAAKYDPFIISPYRRSVISDSVGYFYIDLIPSSDLNSSDTRYLFTASYPAGTVLKKRIAVPDYTNWLLDW
jgi:hypothetical protein